MTAPPESLSDALQRDAAGKQAADAAAAADQAEPGEPPVPYLQPTDRLAVIILNLVNIMLLLLERD